MPSGTSDNSAREQRASASHLAALPEADLRAVAEELGLDVRRCRTRDQLVAAIHDRRRMIEAMDRHAMLELVAWGRREVPPDAGREHLAQEIVRITRMDFESLSPAALRVLAALRNVNPGQADPPEKIIRRLKRQEGFGSWLRRKRNDMLGWAVEKLMGPAQASPDAATSAADPRTDPGGSQPAAPNAVVRAPQPPSMREEIEESGLLGGIASRIKRSADAYLNQKLDEIEARIDRKIDEIDRRLSDWRDKEIANRLRILKITLWASVIVAIISLLYSYVKVYIIRPAHQPASPPAATMPRERG